MRRVYRCALWALLLLVMVTGSAQERATGVISGQVKLPDGTPCPREAVVVRMGEKAYTFTTGDNGSFTGALPTGKAKVTARGQTVTVVIWAGEIATVSIIVPGAGVVVQITTPYGQPVEVKSVLAAYKAPGGDRRGIAGVPLNPGNYLLPEVPADSTALAVIVEQEPFLAAYRKEWTFTDRQAARLLPMVVRQRVPLTIAIVDAQGKPLADTALTGEFHYTLWDQPYWANEGFQHGGHGSIELIKDARTDARGLAVLGEFQANCSYQLNLEGGGYSGDTVKGAIDEAGVSTPLQYNMTHAFRRVVQTVFDAQGRPAPNAEVFATYYWKQETIRRRAVSDADGRVTWENLPPVRVIVWGPSAPAGVLAADAAEAAAPLPAPQPKNMTTIAFRIPLEVTEPLVCHWLREPGKNDGFKDYTVQKIQPAANGDPVFPTGYLSYRVGAPASALAILDTTPPTVACVRDVYVPFYEGTFARMTIDTPIRACVPLHLRFVTPDGAPVPGVSRFSLREVESADPLPAYAFTEDPAIPRGATLLPRERPDGTYDLLLPPGMYRLLVDAFDEAAPALPALTLKVAPGDREVTVTLPAPLVAVPAGATVAWSLRQQPDREHTLPVPASAPLMPFFGPRAEIARLSFARAAGETVVWTPGDETVERPTPRLDAAPPPLPAGGALVFCTFKLRDGTPVNGLNRLAVLDARGMPVPDAVSFPGQYCLRLPAPGAYRLLVDAYDENTPPPSGCALQVKEGQQAVTVILPDPLLTLPAGAEVTWLRRNAPLQPCALTAAAYGTRMPFFGPRDGLLALWYRPTPNALFLWRGDAPAAPRILPLHSVLLQPEDSGFGTYLITSLLPAPKAMGTGSPLTRATGDPTSELTLYPGTPVRCNLWAGAYAAFELTNTSYFSAFDVPAASDGPVEIPLPLDWATRIRFRSDRSQHTVALTFPRADYESWRKMNSAPIAFFDTGDALGLNWDLGGETGELRNCPYAAQSFSLQWLGAGVIRNQPLTTERTLPAWEPGLTVAGTLLGNDGKPLANANLVVNATPLGRLNQWPTGELKLTTDVQGAFTVKGLLPGTLFVRVQGQPDQFAVPVAGQETVQATLKLGGQVTRCNPGERGDNDSFGLCFWLPDNGPPLPLPLTGNGNQIFSAANLPPGPGGFWAVNWNSGGARWAHVDQLPAEITLPRHAPNSLGIALPFEPGRGFPEAVYLRGAGARNGLKVNIPWPSWRYVPALGLVLAEISAVPPGDYTLTVELTDHQQLDTPVTVTDYGGFVSLQ